MYQFWARRLDGLRVVPSFDPGCRGARAAGWICSRLSSESPSLLAVLERSSTVCGIPATVSAAREIYDSLPAAPRGTVPFLDR